MNGKSIELNDPLIYEKDLETICRLLANDSYQLEDVQRDLLCPLGFGPDQYYGYCGLSLGGYHSPALKSVGGIITRDRYGTQDPIVGVAEYLISAANRKPTVTAAPPEIMALWVKEQSKRISRAKLTDEQRERAASSLAELIGDMRPLFFVQTSEGGKDLDALVIAVQRRKCLIVPTFVHGMSASYSSFSGTGLQFLTDEAEPYFQNELYFQSHEIDFRDLTIVSSRLVGGFVAVHDRDTHIVTPPAFDEYDDLWPVLLTKLRELAITFELVHDESYEVGTYKGEDSLRHKLRSGDAISFSVLRLNIL